MLSPVSGTDLRLTLTCSLLLCVSCTDPGQPCRGRALGLQVTPSGEFSQEASPAQPSPSKEKVLPHCTARASEAG